MARWAIIAGPKRTDRSGVALEIAGALKDRGIRVAGVVQLGRFDGEGRRRYDLYRLKTGERLPFAADAAEAPKEGYELFCHVNFRVAAFEAARRWLAEDARAADLLVIGDISKLEVAGGGFDRSIAEALASVPPKVVLLCVRSDQLYYVVERYAIEDDAVAAIELPLDPGDHPRAVTAATAAIESACVSPLAP